jgi:hypothetical protein
MYMPVAAAVAVATWAATVWLDGAASGAARHHNTTARGADLSLVAYTAAATVALYLQYVAAYGLVAVGLYGLARARGRRRWRWLLANAAVGALFAPWLPTFVRQLTVGRRAGEVGAHGAFLTTLHDLLVGVDGMPLANTPTILLLGMLVALGAAVTLRRGWRGSLPLLTLLGPVLGVTAYAAARAVFEVHFALTALPAVATLGAVGLEAVAVVAGRGGRARRRTAGALGLGVTALVLASAGADLRYYLAPPHPNDDYRGLVQTIEHDGRPGDAILLYPPGQDEVFAYYYHGSDRVVGLPLQRPPDPGDVVTRLDALVAGHPRLWVVDYGATEADPTGLVASWLGEHTFLAGHRWFGSVQLLLYAGADPGGGEAPLPVGARLSNGAALLSATLETPVVAPGSTARLLLTWQDIAPIAARYTVFAHLLGVGDTVVAQHDGEPAGATRPTTTWRVGERIADRHGIAVPADLPPGSYAIEVGMYLPQGGQRAQVLPGPGRAASDHLLLGRVTVRAPAASAPPSTPPAPPTPGAAGGG